MATKKDARTDPEAKSAHSKSVPAKSAKKTVKKAVASKSAEGKYTDPALRDRIKAEVVAGDKGGNPGQWSARKAQMVAHEYEGEGGGYKAGPDETQKSLKTWGEEHWTTKDGKAAKREDGMHRYLPKAAWDKLSPAEKASTDNKKLHGAEQGKQFVPNTSAAKSARKRATAHK